MLGVTMQNHQSSQSQVFRGIRFVLLGFDPIQKSQVSRKLVQGGGVDVGRYDPNCTHVIVDKLVYDDPLCVAARHDGKILVSSLWVDHSFDVGAPVDTTSVMYTPVRDLNGIPGAKSLVICLTGYQREDREDIMTMVKLIGAEVSKPLVATKVTHLICYKFEGEKYLLAKRMKRIKLINHRWLEDCLKAWKILPEEDYSKSGYELEMEAEAKDSEDEQEGVATRQNEGRLTSPRHSLLSKQEIPNTISNTSASNLFSTTQETASVTIKTKSGQSPNLHEIKDKHPETVNLASCFTSDPLNRDEKTISSSSAQNHLVSTAVSATKTPQTEAKSYSMKDSFKITPTKTDMGSNTSSVKKPNKFNFSDAFNMSSPFVQKATTFSSPALRPEDGQNDASGGRLKPQQISEINDVESPFREVKKDPLIEKSPARTPHSDIYGRKSLSFKGKNVISDVPISRTSTSEKEYNEASLSTRSNNRDVDILENAMHSPSAVSSDIQKSTLNSGINEQSAGSNSKSVRKKSISKKLSGSKLAKKNIMNQKGSIFLKNTDPGIDDENIFKHQQSENVSPVAKSGVEMKTGVVSGIQVDNMSDNKALSMDDETEPPEDKDESNKEKRENDEPENTVLSMKEVTDKMSVEKNEPVIDNDFEKREVREESTPNRAKRARKNMEVKRAGVCIDLDHNDDVNADMDIENVVNKKEINRNRRSLGKVIIDVSKRYGNSLEKSVEVKKSGVCDDVDADVDIENVVNEKETNGNKRSPSKAKKDVSERSKTDLEKSVEVKKPGVCNDPGRKSGEEGDDVDADMDIVNVVNKKETNRNKRLLSKTKKDASKRNGTDLDKSGVGNAPEYNDEKGDDVDADVENQNVVNENETKRNKRSLSKTKKDVAKRKATDFEKSVEVEDADVDADMDVEEAVNEKEAKKNKRPPSKTKKDADVDTEIVLNKKETKSNKRPLTKTQKDANKAVNKKGKPSSNKLEEGQKENVQIHVNDQSTGDKHVFKPAKEVIKKNNDKGESNVVKDEPMWFILTGHRLQRKEFQQIIKKLKGRVCRVTHNWSYQATHFIVPDPIRRTEKFFAAAASGRWILKTDYLSASNQAGKFVAEEPYEWHKNGLSEDGQINLEAPRKWRLLKEKTGHGAFYGMKIVIYGECIVPPLDTLKRAVKAGDGTILATSPPYTRFLNSGIDFAVVSPGMPHVDAWVQEFLKHEIPCVFPDYLVEYVCKPGYPLEKHVQYGTNAWAERSYNNLQNRYLNDDSEPGTPESDDVACEVCGSRDRGEEMLICGDEGGTIGCGVGAHIDCCDPPLESIPEEDWFCGKCSKENRKNKKGSQKKGKKTV